MNIEYFMLFHYTTTVAILFPFRELDLCFIIKSGVLSRLKVISNSSVIMKEKEKKRKKRNLVKLLALLSFSASLFIKIKNLVHRVFQMLFNFF